MKSFFDIYQHELVLPAFDNFIALPKSQIVTSFNNTLQLFSTSGELLSTLIIDCKPCGLYHYKNRQIIVKSANTLIHYNIETKQKINEISFNNIAKQNLVSIGCWKGGTYYVLSNKLYSNDKEIVLNPILKDRNVQITNKQNLVIYNQLIWDNDNPITILSYSDTIQDDQDHQIIFTNYLINESNNAILILKVMQMKDELIIFCNISQVGCILFYNKSQAKIKDKFDIDANIFDVLKFQQQTGIVVILTTLNKRKQQYRSFSNQESDQCIKIVNLQQKKVLNGFYIPYFNKFSTYKLDRQIYFTKHNQNKQIDKKSLYCLRLVPLSRVYMHLLLNLKFDEKMAKQIVKYVLNVLH